MMRECSIFTNFTTKIDKIKADKCGKKYVQVRFTQFNGSSGQHKSTEVYVLTKDQTADLIKKLQKRLDKMK